MVLCGMAALVAASALAGAPRIPAEAKGAYVVAIGRLDVQAVDVEKVRETLQALVPEWAPRVGKELGKLAPLREAFIKAGGKAAVLVLSCSGPDECLQSRFMVSLRQGADESAMGKVLARIEGVGEDMQLEPGRVAPGWLSLWWEFETGPVGEHAKAIDAALAAAGDSPAVLVFVPNLMLKAGVGTDLRKRREEPDTPAIFASFGGLVEEAIQAKWVSAAWTFGKTPKGQVVVQTADDAAAKRLLAAARIVGTTARETVEGRIPLPPEAMDDEGSIRQACQYLRALEGLKGRAQNGRLTLALSRDELRAAACLFLTASMAGVRRIEPGRVEPGPGPGP